MKSTTCVVVLDIDAARTWGEGLCDKPVVGERAEFPMCQEHMDLFRPFSQPCILTGEDGENADDCTTHEHEED